MSEGCLKFELKTKRLEQLLIDDNFDMVLEKKLKADRHKVRDIIKHVDEKYYSNIL